MSSYYQNFDPTSGINILRVACGLFFIPHIFVKIGQQDFVKNFMAGVGLKPPVAWLYAAMALDIIAAIGLIFAIYTAFAALVAGAFLLAAAWASYRHSESKWIWTSGGAEYPLFWSICCFVIALETWRM